MSNYQEQQQSVETVRDYILSLMSCHEETFSQVRHECHLHESK